MSHTKVAPPPPPAPAAAYYQDDEPVEEKKPLANNGRGLVLKTHCEFPAIGRGAFRDRFAVLVHARAPADVARAPLDLVTVLDVSGSMKGQKPALLKQAMAFVVDQLGPADRLSVVSFSGRAARLTCLARMSDAGKASAKLAVDSLVVESGTNIGEGLRVGAQVLVGRRHKNSVASMILLSDGQDSRLRAKRYMDLVPPLFVLAGSRPGPVHTFGFGANHDVAALHTIAQATGGTFSFVGNQAAIQDSFAQCIGGLLSVAVQEARIAVTCLHRGVHVQEVKSGCYGNHVDAEGRAASIDVGELYEDEERRFLVLVYVSRARPAESVTRLIKVTCGYKDAATGQAANAAAPAAVIQRPLELTDMSPPCMEVERERVRLATAQDIAAAREAAEGGQHAGAARILDSRLKAVERSAPGMAYDPTCEAIKEELRDLSARVGDRREYQQTGRACLMAGMSSHVQQRASAVELQSAKKARPYLTPMMEEMVETSREQSRKRGSSSTDAGSSQLNKQIKQDLTED
ncbi:E3 ubiquitin-protein ligase WAV3-like [Aegilops tauschii subsp. strangulata]|uniref:E3 ubiquitin-protein ligase WAV3-like n=1 Tax=Aegilops tauschii subsp. strangulata TaxID=200361 RepID=UPI001ABD18F6|nr:E3 ubiquitin-protein ligase WAV3-like [Aegilops tauschii subsp. strangulata]